MKQLRFSFLFYIVLYSLVFITTINVYAQKEQDSLWFYYQLYSKPSHPFDLTKSFNFFQTHAEESLKKRDTTKYIYDLRIMADIQYNLGFFYESEKTVVRALRILESQEKNSKSSDMAALYNELGRIKRSLFDYEQAIKFYKKSLLSSQTVLDSLTVFNNLGFTYSKQKKHDLAQSEFEKVYLRSSKLNNQEEMARALNNLGSERAKQDNPEGLQNMLEAFEIRKQLNDIKGLYSSNKHLSEYYQNKNDSQKALAYGHEAYRLAKLLNSMTFLEDALSNLITIEDNPFVDEFMLINDSLSKSKQIEENKFAEMQYNYSEFQRKAQESQLATSEQRTKTLAYQFIGLTISLMAIFLYMFLRTRHKKENLLKVYETETRISKKVHDEVANDIFQVMTKLQTSHNASEPILDELEGIYFKTRDISKENSDIIHDDFRTQLEDLLRSYQNETINVLTNHLKDIDWSLVPDQKKTTLYRVLQELMTNMKKHSKATLVAITFKQKNKKLHIVYKDNGIGTELRKGSGCQNMENRMASIKGMIIFESTPGKGFKASITV